MTPSWHDILILAGSVITILPGIIIAMVGAYAFRYNKASLTPGTNVQPIAASTTIGMNADGTSEFLLGDLAEFIIYNRVLISTEISTVESYITSK